MTERERSIGVAGIGWGDEGKGRLVHKFAIDASRNGPVVVYKDNGGSNAGHTVEFADGRRLALHQFPAGVVIEGATVVLGKGMVFHPGDAVEELKQVKQATGGEIPAEGLIDEMAVLSLDTHRAYESVLKRWQDGSKGSTGRGIAPAYADILQRHPLRVRDLAVWDEDKLTAHYNLYQALVYGLGECLAETLVPTLEGEKVKVGSSSQFIDNLARQRAVLRPYFAGVFDFLKDQWADPRTAFIFEKAQAVGLDSRWGVYPDVTASDTTFANILASSEGVIDPNEIEFRAGVIKGTYMSSVGSRRLPTTMEEGLAQRIRDDYREYGATTKRPRDIAYLDFPALKFLAKVGGLNCVILTHFDAVYLDVPVKVCVGYELKGREVGYRPDQRYLSQVKPRYVEFSPWSKEAIVGAQTREQLPSEAREFLDFVSQRLDLPVVMITFGPKSGEELQFSELL